MLFNAVFVWLKVDGRGIREAGISRPAEHSNEKFDKFSALQ